MNRAVAILKYSTKKVLQAVPTAENALVVASFGRAGSTLIYDSLGNSLAKSRFRFVNAITTRIVKDVAVESIPKRFSSGVVYKTHRYPESLPYSENMKVVFLFGSASDAALSVYEQYALRGEGWVKSHFKHLERPYRFNDLFNEDVLGIRDQCNSWMSCTEIPVLCLRYEKLWENVGALSAFCGVDVSLPERRNRKEKTVSPLIADRVKSVYGEIDNDLSKLPDSFLSSRTYEHCIK